MINYIRLTLWTNITDNPAFHMLIFCLKKISKRSILIILIYIFTSCCEYRRYFFIFYIDNKKISVCDINLHSSCAWKLCMHLTAVSSISEEIFVLMKSHNPIVMQRILWCTVDYCNRVEADSSSYSYFDRGFVH